MIAPLLLKDERLERFRALSDNIMVHNLKKRLPFQDKSVDAVFFSHVLEHIDRQDAPGFLAEIKRVLKPGGIVRIVVPDLEKICRDYLSHVSKSDSDPEEPRVHDFYVAAIIEQSVRREAFGSTQQKPIRRFFENALLGDARNRGETHQWMYDRINLAELLRHVNFAAPRVLAYNESRIQNWPHYGLEVDDHGEEYKPHSLYMEAEKLSEKS